MKERVLPEWRKASCARGSMRRSLSGWLNADPDRLIFAAARAVLIVSLALHAALAASPQIEFDPSATPAVFRVTGLDDAKVLAQTTGAFTSVQWQSIFAVYATPLETESKASTPALLGSYQLNETGIVFQPRFGVEDGMRYRAVYRPAGDAPPLERLFETAPRDRTPTTEVTQVYPTADLLPENQLKFYLHFSAPMSFGEAYRRVHLLDEKGEKIALPFLEIDQELWDPGRRRLTVFFDPGRVKSGLVPNVEEGPPLREGLGYTLLIDRDWLDAEGKRLKTEFRKAFRVGAPDREPPNLATWQLTPPEANSREPLRVMFPEPLDRALLDHLISVTTAERETVNGTITVSDRETLWQLTPQAPWAAGNYILEVGTVLEDLAGNSIGRPFEVDVFEKVEERVSQLTEQLRFQVERVAATR